MKNSERSHIGTGELRKDKERLSFCSVTGKANVPLGFLTLCNAGDIEVISSYSGHFSPRNREDEDDSEKSHGVIGKPTSQ